MTTPDPKTFSGRLQMAAAHARVPYSQAAIGNAIGADRRTVDRWFGKGLPSAAQDAEVTPVAKDRYGRTVGRVTCRQTDASTHQVRNGMAWVYDRYSTPSSPLYATQALARDAGRGLWADSKPVPPWVFRKPEK